MTTSVTLDQWCKAQDRSNVSTESYIPGDGLEKWSKPTVEIIKVNTDAVLFAETG